MNILNILNMSKLEGLPSKENFYSSLTDKKN